MGDKLGLNKHHHQQAVNFIRFSRYKRIQSLKGVKQCFQDVEDSGLYEDTFTVDEVREMLETLLKSVHNEIESELLNSSHTSALLLKQLLTQAEKWHLKLDCDVSELENRDLLEQIAAFEKRELSLSGSNDMNKLKPIDQTSGGAQLLNNEIDRLKAENRNLLSVVQNKSDQLSTIEKSNINLKYQLDCLQKSVSLESKDKDQLEKATSELKVLKNNPVESIESNKDLMENLTSTKHELLKTRKELETTSEELNLKFQQTAAYKNLKEMLLKKNEQIKTLRKSLQKYESQN